MSIWVKCQQDLVEWHEWYAWYPVTMKVWRENGRVCRRYAWRVRIERKRAHYYSGVAWTYREIGDK